MSQIKVDSIKSADGNTDLLTLSNGAVSGVNLGRRNLIINGAMQVWQRGTTVQSDAGYIVDRFKGYSTDSGVANYALKATRQQDSALGLKGYCAEISLTNTGGGINYVTFGTRIEASNFHGVNSGDTMTFSFYLKRSQSADSDLSVYIRSAANGVDSYQSGVILSAYDTAVASSNLGTFNSLSTSWTRYTVTFTVTDALITNGGAVFIENGSSDLNVTNTNALYRTTGWQLEVGSVATPFEHRSYGEELALCQRYYQKSYDYGTAIGTASTTVGLVASGGHQGSTTTGYIEGGILFQMPLRVSPTIVFYDEAGNSGKCTRLSTGVGRTSNQTISTTASEKTLIFYSSGSVAANVITGYFTADAEL